VCVGVGCECDILVKVCVKDNLLVQMISLLAFSNINIIQSNHNQGVKLYWGGTFPKGTLLYLKGAYWYLHGTYLYSYGTNMHPLGTKVYLFERYRPSDSFRTFFSDSAVTHFLLVKRMVLH